MDDEIKESQPIHVAPVGQQGSGRDRKWGANEKAVPSKGALNRRLAHVLLVTAFPIVRDKKRTGNCIKLESGGIKDPSKRFAEHWARTCRGDPAIVVQIQQKPAL